ncbi:hypothetical protein SHELI_v1c06190 [Spiroplasma helicoides]|uniref:Uncharacterized protein n=1 Tax=Spiroplasma helicoides TaxID=216938 RepID=A0A1B3SKX5_9MOLU|nr:SEC-C domain-containing protein [Spiroplasma helicoides]AOG60570.1 hypothetical protein SHELI_v1c06190 [Spiroplasma helicoides]
MQKSEKENSLIELTDRVELYKQAKNINITDEEAQNFVNSILENYFLDNDNISFLQKNGYNFFTFSNNELCFCLSAKTYKECCKNLLKPENEEKDHISLEKALINNKDYESYLIYISELYKKHYEMIANQEVCHYPNCAEKSIECKLYNIDFEKDEFVTTNRINPFDNNFKIGQNFFQQVTKDHFKFYGLCKNHYKNISSLNLSKQSSEEDVLNTHLLPILHRTFILRVELETIREEFLENYLSMKDEGYKALLVYRIKKISNQLKSIVKTLEGYIKNLQKNTNLKVIRLDVPSSHEIKVLDVLYPQISPDDFGLVNSINNIYVEENTATMSIENDRTNSLIFYVYNKKNIRVDNFFKQYLKIIKAKPKFEASFASNCALILTDNVLFTKQYFEFLSDEEKALYSALNKFRFENPNMGQEYLKMKFFAGFNKGNNFFK